MKTFIVYYHNTAPEINRCFGNSIRFETKATNCIQAINKFRKKYNYAIYNVSINHETSLDYDSTQALLKFEGLL